jgi:dipeptide/tripeptide permease
MAKNSRLSKKESASPKNIAVKEMHPLSQRGKKVIAIGAIVVGVGFLLLTKVDPAGQNWAGTVSPAIILLGYALIGVGIVLPDPISATESTSSPQA